MKKGEGPAPIDFTARARAFKERQAKEAKSVEVKASTQDEPENTLIRLVTPRPPLRALPKPDQPEIPHVLHPRILESGLRGVARSGLNLRILSRLDLGDHGLDSVNHDFLGLLAGPDDRKKLDRLVMMETALRGLSVKPANIDIRRGILRSYGTNDLTGEFWGSTESNWTAQPSMYIALLDELESRSFFNIRNVPPRTPRLPRLNPPVDDRDAVPKNLLDNLCTQNRSIQTSPPKHTTSASFGGPSHRLAGSTTIITKMGCTSVPIVATSYSLPPLSSILAPAGRVFGKRRAKGMSQ